MKIPIYQVDAFTDKLFSGNPAAVCPLDDWLPDSVMQSIGLENNLSETAFLVGKNGSYKIRWFTPQIEIELCGHATLASAYTIFNFIEPELQRIEFMSASGTLIVTRSGDLLNLDFPARDSEQIPINPELSQALGVDPISVFNSKRPFAVFDNEAQIRDMRPNFSALKAVKDIGGVVVTAPGDTVDFVSRFFAPALGIDEDPVTGSAHCSIVPYWAGILGKAKLHALQVSPRGGELWCEYNNNRVYMSGKAVLYMKGEIYI